MRKIRVITGTRADYGLLYWTMRLLSAESTVDFGVIVTGGHLETAQGMTIDQVIKDGFPIVAQIPLHQGGDRPRDLATSLGVATSSLAKFLEIDQPDIVVFLGDRWEILGCAIAGMLTNTPMAHIHGGEATWGLIDDPIRHSLTKMSHLHFVTTKKYAERVIQLGESPDRVHVVGAPGLDYARKATLLSRDELRELLGSALGEKNILVTYHPVTLSETETDAELSAMFDALSAIESGVRIWIGMPNQDTYSHNIRARIQKFLSKHSNASSFTSLGSLGYWSMMSHVDLMVGNSSSGIIEAPFLGTRVIDIGRRQAGRLRDVHVTSCTANATEILGAIKAALSSSHRLTPSTLYGDGSASEKIVKHLIASAGAISLQKGFHDLT